MKLLLVLLIALTGVALWQRGRQTRQTRVQARGNGRATPMVRCARCGTHVPAHEAIAGRDGAYCCVNHRQESEGA